MKRRRVMILGTSLMDQLVGGVFDYVKANTTWEVKVEPIQKSDPSGSIRWNKPDGVIISHPDESALANIVKVTPNVVAINTNHPPSQCPSVHVDDKAIGCLAANHLLSYGHRYFGFYGWEIPWSHDRLAGFEETIRDAGHAVRTLQTKRGSLPTMRTLDRRGGEMVMDWLRDLPRPVGIMINHDMVAYNLYDACEALGLRVPDDIAVVSVDNMELLCMTLQPALTSIDTNLTEAGYRSAIMLDDLFHGRRPTPYNFVIAPRDVIVRQSTDRHNFEDEEVNRALKYIRANADEPISVEDVLEEVHISRSSLESRFRAYLGHTPGAEIRHVRLERARKLLLDSNMSLIEIAVRCGFSSISYLSQAFKRTYGVPPRKYREEYKRR